MKDVSLSPELMKKIENCNSAEELMALAEENQVEISAEEAESVLSSFKKELTDEEVDTVSGGHCWTEECSAHLDCEYDHSII